VPPLKRLTTFASVGAAATIGYAIIAGGLVFFAVKPLYASLIAYGICASGSYLGHKRFTFGSPESHAIEAPRFFAATLIGLAVAVGMPILYARFFGPSPWFAILATCVLVPILSYLLSQRFVFRAATPRAALDR
jgi:putative flippase GtrA